MRILAIDDEYLALEGISYAIKNAAPDAELRVFKDPDDALASFNCWIPDVAFLDIEMRTANGIEVAKQLKQINPKINIIFVTGYSEYMKEAFDLYASGYVLKPVIPENIKQELEHLRFPVIEKNRICVQTFGDFEIFGDGIPLSFAYSKSKELIAILVDANGATCNMGKIEEMLWEHDFNDHRGYIRNLIADIRKVFRQYGAEDVIIRSNNLIGLDMSKIDCDYADYLAGRADSQHQFRGYYMNQYSWAETTLGMLLDNKKS